MRYLSFGVRRRLGRPSLKLVRTSQSLRTGGVAKNTSSLSECTRGRRSSAAGRVPLQKAVQDLFVAEPAESAPGRSEKVGFWTGVPASLSEATCSGASGWENRFRLSMCLLATEKSAGTHC